MKFTQRLSLRVRLTLIFLILASVTWLLSSFVAWKQTTDNVDELFDTQLMLFAKRLSTLISTKSTRRIAWHRRQIN